MKITVCCGFMLCNLRDSYQYIGETCCPKFYSDFFKMMGPYLFTTCHHASEYSNLYGFYTILGKRGKPLCSVDHASLYNLVNNANLVHYLFLVYLFISLCMFQVTMCSSSGETTVWYAGWIETHSTLHTRQSSTQNNKYQVLHKHSCFS